MEREISKGISVFAVNALTMTRAMCVIHVPPNTNADKRCYHHG